MASNHGLSPPVLRGFNAKTCNTLYVDKNLRYHGLIQAFSRTNRTLGQKKSQGSIVCFRNLKERVDEAIALISSKEARNTILMEPYQAYVDQFNEAVVELMKITAPPEMVDKLQSEEDLLAFVRAFRELIRIRNILTSFTEFSDDDLALDFQRCRSLSAASTLAVKLLPPRSQITSGGAPRSVAISTRSTSRDTIANSPRDA